MPMVSPELARSLNKKSLIVLRSQLEHLDLSCNRLEKVYGFVSLGSLVSMNLGGRPFILDSLDRNFVDAF